MPKLMQDPSVLPLLVDTWNDDWQRGPLGALRRALSNASATPSKVIPQEQIDMRQPSAVTPLDQLQSIELALIANSNLGRIPFVIFDQFDDYQARHRVRFLPRKIWLTPDQLRRKNAFWDMIARLLASEKIRCLLATRSDTAAGLTSIEFFGPVSAYRLDRVQSQFVGPLLKVLSRPHANGVVVADPDRGWNRLVERIVRDLSHDGVVLPQQLKVVLAGIQSLRRLDIANYDRAGGAPGVEALFVLPRQSR
jgi:hypothetical protein